MQKRTVLTVIICAVLFGAWLVLDSRLNPKKPAAQQPQEDKTPANPAAPSPVSAAAPSVAVVVTSPGVYTADLSEQGMRHFQILTKQYAVKDQRRLEFPAGADKETATSQQGDQPMDMVPTYQPSLDVALSNGSVRIPPDAKWELVTDRTPACIAEGPARFTVPAGGCELAYRTSLAEGVSLQKTYRFYQSLHQVDLQVTVANQSAAVVDFYPSVGVAGFQDPAQKPGIFSERHPQNELMWDLDGKTKRLPLDDAKKTTDPSDNVGAVGWIGVGTQYFLQAVGFDAASGSRKVAVRGSEQGFLGIRAEGAHQVLQPGKTWDFAMAYYAGPKIPERLKGVAVAGQSVGLDRSIDYTLGFIARPLLWILRQIYQWVHNWPLAIVLLTLLVKLATLYPSYRSTKSMKAMSNLKPQVDALKKKYGEDKQKFNQEMMQLYRRNGVNPLGGCLPMLIQMPIYFALYSMLGNAVELYRVPLIAGLNGRWVQDLTGSDPYFILPLLTGALMFWQTKMTPSPSADAQQKLMMWLMPIMFTVLGVFMPAGLSIYILTNTLLGILQQVITNRLQQAPARK